jgi:hypothetical protein
MVSNDIYVGLNMEAVDVKPLATPFNPYMPCVTNKLLQCPLNF